MQRRKRDVALQPRQRVFVDQHWAVVVGTTVDDTMADGGKLDRLRIAQPMPRGCDRRRNVSNLMRGIMPVDQCRSVARLGAKSRLRAYAVYLRLDEPAQFIGCGDGEQLKFDARGARI